MSIFSPETHIHSEQAKLFYKTFNVPCNKFIDRTLGNCLDIIEFDMWLMTKFPYYASEEISTSDFLKRDFPEVFDAVVYLFGLGETNE